MFDMERYVSEAKSFTPDTSLREVVDLIAAALFDGIVGDNTKLLSEIIREQTQKTKREVDAIFRWERRRINYALRDR